MSKRDAGKKPAAEKAPASRKPNAELKESELEQISAGLAPVVFLGHGIKKPAH